MQSGEGRGAFVSNATSTHPLNPGESLVLAPTCVGFTWSSSKVAHFMSKIDQTFVISADLPASKWSKEGDGTNFHRKLRHFDCLFFFFFLNFRRILGHLIQNFRRRAPCFIPRSRRCHAFPGIIPPLLVKMARCGGHFEPRVSVLIPLEKR